MPVVENNYASTMRMIREAEGRAMEARHKCLNSLYCLASLKLSLLQEDMKTFMNDLSSIKASNFEKPKRRSTILNTNEEEDDSSDIRDYVKLDLPRLKTLCDGASLVQTAIDQEKISAWPMALMTREFYGSDVALDAESPISVTMDGEMKKTLQVPAFDASSLSKDPKKAQDNLAKAQEYQQICQQYIEIIDEIRGQSSLFFNCLYNLDNSWFKSVMESMHKLLGGKKRMGGLRGQKNFSSENMELIGNTVNLAQQIQQVIETDIVDSYGILNTRDTKRILARLQKNMGSEISLPTPGVQQAVRDMEEKLKQVDREYAEYLKKKEAEEAAERQAREEARKAEEARIAAEKAKQAEEARRLQEAKAAAEKAKQAEEARKAEEAKKAEEARRAAEEAKRAEEARKAQAARIDREMQAALEESRKATAAIMQAEEARKAAQAKTSATPTPAAPTPATPTPATPASAMQGTVSAQQAEAAKRAEEQRKAEERRNAELQRQAAMQQEAQKKAEEQRRAEEQRKAEERRNAELQRQAAMQQEAQEKTEEQRQAEERRNAELQRQAAIQQEAQKRAEEQRKAEEQRNAELQRQASMVASAAMQQESGRQQAAENEPPARPQEDDRESWGADQDADNVRNASILELEIPKFVFWIVAALFLLLAVKQVYSVNILSAVVLIAAAVLASPLVLDNMSHIIKIAIAVVVFVISFVMPNQIIPHESGDNLVSVVQSALNPPVPTLSPEEIENNNYLGSNLTKEQYEFKYQNYKAKYKGKEGISQPEVEAALQEFLYEKDGIIATELIIDLTNGKQAGEQYQIIQVLKQSEKKAVIYLTTKGKNYKLNIVKQKGNKIKISKKTIK